MNSFLIIAETKEKGLEEARELCRRLRIDKLDVSTIESEKAIGIEDVRKFQEKIFLAPFKGKVKAEILIAIPGITPQAQNAMLKILEEPPEFSYILLVVDSKDLLLPTVLSRCFILEEKKEKQTEKSENLEEILYASVGEKIKRAEELSKNKQEAIEWLESLINSARENIISGKTNDKKYSQALINFYKTYTILKNSNANTRLILENLFLGLN